MKILLAHKYFYNKGGAEVFFLETARILEERGHEIAYFSANSENNLPSKYSSFFTKPPAYENGNMLKRLFSIVDIVYSRKAKKKFIQLLEVFKPDVVHMFAINVHLSPSILEACKEAGFPVVMSCNDYKHICPNYKLYYKGRICEDCKGGKFYHASLNRCLKNSLVFSFASSIEAYFHNAWNIYRKNIDTFLFASQFMINKTEEFWGKDTFRWRLLKNPFESTIYPLSKTYNDYFLFFGRLTEEKGVSILLEAMKQLPDKKLLIIGDGPQQNGLEALSHKHHLNNVKFLGPKWGRDLEEILKHSRFVVVPSIWHENFPYVILQSFAFGKAVISTNRGGIPELVTNGKRGLIYSAEDSHALAGCIRDLWENPDYAVRMGVAAKKYVDQEFSYDKFYQHLMDIYKGVLK